MPVRRKSALPLSLLLAVGLACLGHTQGLSSCGGSCSSDNDCAGALYCGPGRKCADDPNVGTTICKTPSPSPRKQPPSSPPPPKKQPPPSPPPKSQPPPPISPTCTNSGYFIGVNAACTSGNMAECCKAGTKYPKYYCSPPVTSSTSAILTLNDFQLGGDGGGLPSCLSAWPSNSDPIVALSTGWFKGGSRCKKYITIKASNGKTVRAMVVDECDSTVGCDKEHDGQPPCMNNVVDGSAAVWSALGISSSSSLYGYMSVTWWDS